jgi:hypothetical protein
LLLRRWSVVLAAGAAAVALVAALPSSAQALSAARNSAGLTGAPVTLTPAPIGHAPSLPADPAVQRVKLAGIVLLCFPPGAILYVTQNNIHIRQTPNGASVASLTRRAWFDSGWKYKGKGPYHCMANKYTAGTLWVYGYSNHNHKLIGFVGFNWLNFRNYFK